MNHFTSMAGWAIFVMGIVGGFLGVVNAVEMMAIGSIFIVAGFVLETRSNR